ncbi:pyroglutamyl-peptidase I family protein [Cylindrospermum sp. FACHB-282]|uniref:pyroglutamyl-peptidase I family protein n=1 Tax=Cylindrospermum sp. FACHB-282 TaxID=2692794 RepID=UPI001683E059|nr:peptidase C15 [Cylindrospermum sp. FACHB-282]MBD2387545.1 peptidase C15 [Cylindrospermum sp. FACHB-282]
MQKTILLTSFDTWLAEQQSNSSDDLLLELAKLASVPHDLTFLRLLPVDVQLASSLVIAKINELQPDYIICCGMAASRSQLNIEVVARNTNILPVESTDIYLLDSGESILQTTIDLQQLVAETTAVEISYDCGKFVCNGLYYSVLDYLRQSQLPVSCVFVHVPVLNEENLSGILTNFVLILNKLALL